MEKNRKENFSQKLLKNAKAVVKKKERKKICFYFESSVALSLFFTLIFFNWSTVRSIFSSPEISQAQVADDGLKVSMCIWTFDKDGARAKQGDIIAIKPAGSSWGKKSQEVCLIVEVDLGDSIKTLEDAKKLTIPLYEDGSLWYPPEDAPQSKILSKRRYSIPFDDLDMKAKEKGINLDFTKIVDQKKKKKYQPLEKTVLNFDGLIQDKALDKKLGSEELKIIKKAGK